VVEKLKAMETNMGFNAETEKYEDMFAAGVIDPTKVSRSALQNASSIASLMLTTEAIGPRSKEDEKMLQCLLVAAAAECIKNTFSNANCKGTWQQPGPFFIAYSYLRISAKVYSSLLRSGCARETPASGYAVIHYKNALSGNNVEIIQTGEV